MLALFKPVIDRKNCEINRISSHFHTNTNKQFVPQIVQHVSFQPYICHIFFLLLEILFLSCSVIFYLTMKCKRSIIITVTFGLWWRKWTLHNGLTKHRLSTCKKNTKKNTQKKLQRVEQKRASHENILQPGFGKRRIACRKIES